MSDVELGEAALGALGGGCGDGLDGQAVRCIHVLGQRVSARLGLQGWLARRCLREVVEPSFPERS